MQLSNSSCVHVHVYYIIMSCVLAVAFLAAANVDWVVSRFEGSGSGMQQQNKLLHAL